MAKGPNAELMSSVYVLQSKHVVLRQDRGCRKVRKSGETRFPVLDRISFSSRAFPSKINLGISSRIRKQVIRRCRELEHCIMLNLSTLLHGFNNFFIVGYWSHNHFMHLAVDLEKLHTCIHFHFHANTTLTHWFSNIYVY